MGPGSSAFVLLGLILIGLVHSAPVGNQNTPIQCPGFCGDSTNFDYQVGKSYIYAFKSQTSFGSIYPDVKADLASTQLTISGQARITVQTKCEHLLKLENVVIEGIKDQGKLVAELEQKSLSYFFNDGLIQSICPLEDEPEWALNVKRAVLSTLQVSLVQPIERLTTDGAKLVSESDVLGNCDTQYELVSKDGKVFTVEKRKLLGTCSQRVQMHIPLSVGSAFGELLLRSLSTAGLHQKHSCRIRLQQAGIVLSSSCTGVSDADQIFADGLHFNSTMSIEFSNEQPIHYPPLTGAHRVSSLLGEPLPEHSAQAAQFDDAPSLADAISAQCKAIGSHQIDSTASDAFQKLVLSMQRSSYEQIKAEYQKLLSSRNAAMSSSNKQPPQKPECSPLNQFKLYIDALQHAQTEHTLRVIVEQLIPNNFYLDPSSLRGQIKLRLFYASLPFYPSANENMLNAVRPLLKAGQPQARAALLGASGLAGSFCAAEPHNCDKTAVHQLAKDIAAALPANCASKTPAEELEASTRLYALQNFRQLPVEVSKKLLDCASNEKAPLGMRVAAIEAANRKHQPESDSSALQQTAKQILFNPKHPDELRIAAYNAWLRFAQSEKHREQLQQLVNDGGEVASYIASHLQLLRAQNPNTIKCPFVKKYAELTASIANVEKAALTGRSRRVEFRPNLGYILRDKLSLHASLVTDARTEQSISFKACIKLSKQKLLSFGLRQTISSVQSQNNVHNLANSAQSVLQSVVSRANGDSSIRLDSLLDQIVPQLQAALEGAEVWIKVDGKIVYYRAANELQYKEVSKMLSNGVQYGLAHIFGSQKRLSMQVHGFSGVPSVYSLNRTVIFSLPNLLDKVSNQPDKVFDILPSIVASTQITHRISVGSTQQLVAQLHRQSYVSSGFGLKANLKSDANGWQLELRLPKDQVELLSYRVSGELQLPTGKRQPLSSSLPGSSALHRDLCVDNVLPLKSLLGINICVKEDNGQRRLLLSQHPGSVLVISKQAIVPGKPDEGLRYSVKLNNAGQPREVIIETRSDYNKYSSKLLANTPIAKATAQLNWTEPQAAVLLQIDDNKDQFDLRWTRNRQSLGQRAFRWVDRAEVKLGRSKFYAFENELTMDASEGLKLNEQLFVGEKKRKVLDLKYEHADGKRFARAVGHHHHAAKTVKIDYKFQPTAEYFINGEHVYVTDAASCKYNAKIEYKDPINRKQNSIQHKLEMRHPSTPDSLVHYEVDAELQTTQWPEINHKLSQKVMYKPSQHFEHELHVQSLKDTSIELKISHLSKFNNFDNPQAAERSQEHLLRVLIAPLLINREYSYNGKYIMSGNEMLSFQFDDKLTVQDLAASKQLVAAGLKMLVRKDDAKKVDVNGYVHCSEHGRIDYEELVEILGKGVQSKIKLQVAGSQDAKPTVYTGEYRADDLSLHSKKYEVSIRRESDGKAVFNLKNDYTQAGPTVYKGYTEAKLDDEHLFKLVLDIDTQKREGEYDVLIKNVGQLRYSKRSLPEDKSAKRVQWSALSAGGYFSRGNLTVSDKAFNLQEESYKQAESVLPLKADSIDKAAASLAKAERVHLSQALVAWNKPIRTLGDIHSAQINLQCPYYRAMFKRDLSNGIQSHTLELENLKKKRKCSLMITRESKRSIMVAYRSWLNNAEQTVGELALATKTPSVLNLKGPEVFVYLLIDPYRTKATPNEWLILDFKLDRSARKAALSLRQQDRPGKKQTFVISAQYGGVRRSTNAPFESQGTITFTENLYSLEANFTAVSQGQNHHTYWSHDYEPSLAGYSLKHSVFIKRPAGLLFSHKLDVQKKRTRDRYELSIKSQLDGKEQHLKGAAGELNLVRTSKDDYTVKATVAYPFKKRNYSLEVDRKGSWSTNGFKHNLNAQLEDQKLNYRDQLQYKLDDESRELILKYERKSNAGHQLELLELSGKYTSSDKFFKLAAPRGWQASGQFKSEQGAVKLTGKLVKRGRTLIGLDRFVKFGNNPSPLTPELATTEITYNGVAKYIADELKYADGNTDYKLKTPIGNLDLQVKLAKDSQQLDLKACKPDDSACHTVNIKKIPTAAGHKSEIKLNAQVGGKPLVGQIELNAESNRIDISGKLNDKDVKGELSVQSDSRSKTLKLQIGERLMVWSREMKSENIIQYNFWPNQKKDSAHVHTLQLEYQISDDSAGTRMQTHQVVAKVTNPALKTPITLTLTSVNEYDGIRSRTPHTMNATLQYSADPGKQLTLSYTTLRQTKTASMIDKDLKETQTILIRTGDGRLNGGCTTTIDRNLTMYPTYLMNLLHNRECHWALSSPQDIARSNRKITLNISKDDKHTEIKLNEISRVFFDAIEYTLYFKRVGNQITDLWSDAKLNGKHERSELSFNGNCVRMIRFTPPGRDNHLSVRGCLNGAHNDTILLVEAYQHDKSAKAATERLTVRLEKTPDEDLHLLLHWDPDLIGEVIATASERLNERLAKQEQTLKVIRQEARDKLQLVCNDFSADVLKPLAEHLKAEVNEIRKELGLPEMSSLRSKREADAAAADDQMPDFEQILREVFNWRVKKYSVEEGEIDVYFRIQPSSKAIAKLISQAIRSATH